MLTPWRGDRILVDPFCGSGTFPIEAAMMAANMAPGMNRSFTAENWAHIVKKRNWYDALDEANELVDLTVQPDIQGYDLDERMVAIARENAKLAGVDKLTPYFPVSVLNPAVSQVHTQFTMVLLFFLSAIICITEKKLLSVPSYS